MKKKDVQKSNISKKPKTRSIQKEPPNGQLGLGLVVGDALVLQEWDGVDYTGREIKRNVTYMLSGCNGLYGDNCNSSCYEVVAST